MSLRSFQIYVTAQTARDARTAATLAGLESADEWAEMVLQREIAAIPALGSLRQRITAAVAAAKKEWAAEHMPKPEDNGR